MIHIFIPLLASLLLGATIHKRNAFVGTCFYVLALIFGVVTGVCWNGQPYLVDSIPLISIDDSEQMTISNKGVAYVESGYSPSLSSQFMLSDNIDKNALTEWLKDSNHVVYFYVKEGNDYVWSRSLGLADENLCDEIVGIYESWRTDGTVPKNKVRYRFLCFYIDV